MATAGILAPPVRWYVSDKLGNPLIGGKLYSYEWSDKSTPKPIYKDINCTDPYPNPMVADGSGCFPDLNDGKQMYWKSDSQYYLRFYDKDGALVNDSLAFPPPASDGGSTPVVASVVKNLFNNGDFKYRKMNKFFSNDIPGGGNIGTESTLIADTGWYFFRNNSIATNAIEFVDFIVGQSEVPYNPKSYLNYKCTVPGSGESTKTSFQRFNDVTTLSGKLVSFSVYARSPDNASTVKLIILQYFGSGGSPDVVTTQDIQLTTSWAYYKSPSVLIPSISGKVVGAGSCLMVGIQYPNNTTCNIDFTIPQLNLGASVNEYDYKTFEQEAATQKPWLLPEFPDTVVNKDPNIAYDPVSNIWNGDVLTFNAVTGRSEWGSPVPVGSWLGWMSEFAPPSGWFSITQNPGWLVRGIYQRLYDKWGIRYGLDTTYKNNFTATALGNIVTVTCGDGRVGSGLGAMTHFQDNNTGWTFNTTQAGTPSQPEITNITCSDAINFKGGENFSFGTPSGLAFYVYIVVGGAGVDPNIPGKTSVPLALNLSDTANTVAIKLRNLFNPFIFYTPKTLSGRFLRVWDNGAGIDPDRTSRIEPNADCWGAGDHIGTTQADNTRLPNHSHPFTIDQATSTTLGVCVTYTQPLNAAGPDIIQGANQKPGATYNGTTSTTQTTGEVRPTNVYTDIIFKY